MLGRVFSVKTRYIKRFLTGLTIFLLSGFSVMAQSSIDLNLKLKNSNRFEPIPRSGEFSLSLDSQLFERSLIDEDLTPLTDENSAPDVLSDSDRLDVLNLSEDFSEKANQQNTRAEDYSDEDKNFSSTLTLTTGYSQLSLSENNPEGLRLEKKLGKFKILGEFAQQTITRIPLPQESGSFSSNANNPLTRASLINTPSLESDLQSKNSALASRYYLEAIYSFKPSVQGKLSYRRSMVDTIESEEKLQFEGIVEANRNVLIKAGYNNETRPEVNEPKATKDSKVWTEFILKF